MRTIIFTLIGAFAITSFATGAAAQGLRVVGGSSGPAMAEPAARPVQHEVRPGDTLWDLTEGFYGNPWYWPQVWSRNPQVSNPHFIYPGDRLTFVPLAETKTTAAEQAGPREQPGMKVAGARVRFVPKEWEHQVYVRYVGFLTEEEIRAAGVIRFSREQKEMLGELDEVYIDFERLPRVRPGDRWTILNLKEDLHHPIYERKLGKKVDILGVVDIRAVSRKVAIGVIVRSYQEIKRGAMVIPLVPNFRSVRPRPNSRNVRGYVVDSFQDVLNIGQHQTVFIDKGVREGVEVGNRFHVVRQGDGVRDLSPSQLKMLPWEPIGEIMVIETRDHHCTGVVLGDLQEIVVGDVVEMRESF